MSGGYTTPRGDSRSGAPPSVRNRGKKESCEIRMMWPSSTSIMSPWASPRLGDDELIKLGRRSIVVGLGILRISIVCGAHLGIVLCFIVFALARQAGFLYVRRGAHGGVSGAQLRNWSRCY